MYKIFVLLLFIIINSLYADAKKFYKVIKVASDDTLSIREQPSYKTQKLGELPYNANCINILDLSNKKGRSVWAFIEYKSIRGWVNSKYLHYSNRKCNKPAIQAKPVVDYLISNPLVEASNLDTILNYKELHQNKKNELIIKKSYDSNFLKIYYLGINFSYNIKSINEFERDDFIKKIKEILQNRPIPQKENKLKERFILKTNIPIKFNKINTGAKITLNEKQLHSYAKASTINCYEIIDHQIPKLKRLLQKFKPKKQSICRYGSRILSWEGENIYRSAEYINDYKEYRTYIKADSKLINKMGKENKGKDIISEIIVQLQKKTSSSTELVYNYLLIGFTLKNSGYEFIRTTPHSDFSPRIDVEGDKEDLSYMCDAGNAKICYDLGYQYSTWENYASAILYFEKSCELGKGIGCYALGLYYNHGNGVEKNNRSAIKYFKLSCKYNYAKGCYTMGALVLDNEGYLEKDKNMRKKYIQKACSLGSEKACTSIISTKMFINKVRSNKL